MRLRQGRVWRCLAFATSWHCWPPMQAFPQTPQFAESFLRSGHVSSEQGAAPLFSHTHTPDEHVEPFGQLLPQVPQLSLSLESWTQLSEQAENPRLESQVQVPPVPVSIIHGIDITMLIKWVYDLIWREQTHLRISHCSSMDFRNLCRSISTISRI